MKRTDMMHQEEPMAREKLLHTLFEAQAAATPHHIALQTYQGASSRSMTYGELNGYANKIARVVQAAKAPGVSTVAICMDKGPELMAAILAILKCGCAWSPVDPGASAERKSAIVRALGHCHLLMPRKYASGWSAALPETQVQVSVWEELEAQMAGMNECGDFGEAQGTAESACHILWTSGTTGIPKGVVIAHQSVVNNAMSLAQLFGLHPDTRTLQFAHFTFDVFALDVFMTLSVGGCLIVGEVAEMLSDLTKFVVMTRASYAQLTPSVIQLLHAERASGGLATLASSGEAMTEDIVRKWATLVQLYNCYGPTETDVVTVKRMTPTTLPACVGTALPGCQVSVRGEQGQILPFNSIGEICVAGVQVMKGYLGAAVEADESVWHTDSSGRAYRTGDYGRMDEEGAVYCLGRSDDEVKVRGQRVSLVGVEDTIRRLTPDLRAVAVLLPRSGMLHGQLCCFLELMRAGEGAEEDGEGEDAAFPWAWTSAAAVRRTAAVREQVQQSTLSQAAMPTSWWLLGRGRMPLGASGKIDRRMLLRWTDEAASVRTHPSQLELHVPRGLQQVGDGSAPESESEHLQVIQHLWATLLGLHAAAVPLHTPFFAAGGHSMLAVKVVVALRARGLSDFTIVSLNEVDTVAKQAALLGRADKVRTLRSSCCVEADVPYALLNPCLSSHDDCQRVIQAAAAAACSNAQHAIQNIYPCTPMQCGLMSASLQRPGTYISTLTIRTENGQQLDRITWDAAWSQLVAVEPILRTRLIVLPEHGMLQVVLRPECEAQYAPGPASRDLGLGSRLWEYRWRNGSNADVVHLRLHHAILDGAQVPLVLNRLGSIYDALRHPTRTPSPPTSSTPFTHFLHYLQRHVPQNASNDFWRHVLKDQAPPNFPSPMSSVPKHITSRVLSSAIRCDYRALAAQGSVPPGALLAALWSLVYSGFADTTTVVYGMVHSGRDVPLDGVEDIVAPTIAITPFVANMNRGMTFADLIAAHHASLTEMAPHRHIGLPQIQALGASYRAACDFRALLVIHSEIDSALAKGPLVLEDVSEDRYDYPLVLSMTMKADHTVQLHCTYEEACISPALVQCILHRLAHVTQQLEQQDSGGLQRSLTSLQLSTQTQLDDVMVATPAFCAQDMCVQDIIHQSALRTPHDPAVFDQALGLSLTYADVVRLSRLLAHAIVLQDAEPASVIPLCIQSSAHALIGILAIQQAGCAYMPIDIDHPPARHDLIFAQAKAKVLLCTTRTCAKFTRFAGQIINVDDVIPIASASSAPARLNHHQESLRLQPATLREQEGDIEVHLSDGTTSVRPDATAVVLFTSGSTGVPKGVELTHANVATAVHSLIDAIELTQGARVFQFSALTFDFSLLEIYGAWARSGCICIPSPHSRMNRTSEVLGEMQVDTVMGTPTLASLLRTEDVLLRTMVLAGERITRELANQWSGRLRLYQTYGPAECTISVSATRMWPDCLDLHDVGPVVNAEVRIMDANHRQVPPGYPGEIAISGPTVGRGYLNDPDRTQRAFISLPTSSNAPHSQRFYLTGDIGRQTVDGRILFEGRKDGQVKINAIRIEVGEIEDCMLGAGCSLRNVAVAYIPKKLVAFLHRIEGAEACQQVTLSRLRKHLQAQMPKYMIPSQFVWVQQWPQTSSGKTDRKALVADFERQDPPEHCNWTAASQEDVCSEQQSNDQEPDDSFTVIRRMLIRSLKLPENSKINPSDTFFDLGGDSLAAMKFVAAARAENIELSVEDIFRSPAVSSMHRLMFKRDPVEVACAGSDVSRFSLVDFVDPQEVSKLTGLTLDFVEDIYPCTPFQEGVAALASASDDLYVARHVFTCTPCDRVRFTEALSLVVSRTAIFRTVLMLSKNLGALQLAVRPESPSIPKARFHASVEDLISGPVRLQDAYLCNFEVVAQNDMVTALALTMSHAAYDGWSQELFLDDLSKAYIQGNLSPPPATFSQFISYQHHKVHQPGTKDFWTGYLSGAQASSWPRVPRNGHTSVCANLEYATAGSVAWQSQGPQRTAILRGAWALLLAQYENTPNPCFATVFSGRTANFSHIESVSGPTMAAAVMHASSDPQQTVAAYLELQQHDFQAILPHSAYGLQNIKRLSDDAANACKVRTMLVIQLPEVFKPDRSRQIEFHLIHESMSRGYPITLTCVPREDGFRLCISYDSDWVTLTAVERLARQYLHVVGQLSMCALRHRSTLNDIDMLPPQDLEQILAWNSAKLKTRRTTLNELMQRAMSKYTESPAIEGPQGEVISYQSLELHVCFIAETLRVKGVRQGDRVLIRMAKSMHQIAALLALTRLCAVFVPVDLDWPRERVRQIAEHAHATFAVVDSGTLPFVQSSATQEIPIEALQSGTTLRSSSQHADMAVGRPEDLAYIIYTSGSTGTPKGILTSHLAACTTLLAQHENLNLTSESRTLHFSSLSFDPSIRDIFGTLSIGGCICLPSEDQRSFELEETICRMQANWLWLTPSVATLLRPERVPTIKTLCLGGESIPQSLADAWINQVHLIYTYGPSEATINTSASHNCQECDCIGLGMGTTSLWIVCPNDHTRLAPIGAVGELLCVGPSVADGYLDNEEGTARAFVAPPQWVDEDSKKWKAYRTGDLVQYNADGTIRILGRADGQLKIRGKRIELSEIDTAVGRTGIVKQAVTDVVNKNGTPLLVVFITMDAEEKHAEACAEETCVISGSTIQQETIQEIRSSLQQHLPAYMQPWAIIAVNQIPRSSTGKTDRRTLKRIAEAWSPPEDGDTTKTAIRIPESTLMSPAESDLREIWSEVLGIDARQIGRNDTFARLGGDSISLMRFVHLYRARHCVLDVKGIHLGLNLEDMATRLAENGGRNQTPPPLTVEPFSLLGKISLAAVRGRLHVKDTNIVDAYPASPMQTALIAASAKTPGSFFNKLTFQLPNTTNIPNLETAVRGVVQHQEILRTAFITDVEGVSVQAVLQNGSQIERRTEGNAHTVDTDEPNGIIPPATFSIERTSQSIVLEVVIHHAAMDAVSGQMLAHDLNCAYSSQPLPERPAYNTFIRHLQDLNSEDNSRKAWEASMHRPIPTAFPFRDRLEDIEQRGQCTFQINMSNRAQSQWSPSEVLVAALAILLGQTSGAHSVCFGLVLSGRLGNLVGLEKIAGPTLTTVPVISDLELAASKHELLSKLREDLRTIRTHEHFGLSNIAKLNHCARQAVSFTTLLVVHPEREGKEESHIFNQYTCESLQPTCQYPLEIECRLGGNVAEVTFTYDGRAVGAVEAEWLKNRFKRVVEHGFCSKQELNSPLQEFSMLTDEEEKQVDDWNSAIVEAETRSLHLYFSETAARAPENLAVVEKETEYTYAALDRLSSILADTLVKRGVKPGAMVPLMFEKSAISVVAILGVLKAGAAYVPLDPRHPPARLEFIKADIRGDIVICSPTLQEQCQLWNDQIILDRAWLQRQRDDSNPLAITTSPEDPAYVMFTSGSSGRPKGVVISHAAASTSIRSQISAFGFGPDSKIMHFCSYTFDVSVMEIFATLCSGATLFIPSEQDRCSCLASYIRDVGIQTAILTPTVVRTFLTPEQVPCLQQLILVGEPCSQKVISEWSSRVQLINDYGPTETTIDSCTNTSITETTKASNVGYPIAGHAWIVRTSDPSQLCPLGAVGELLISGPTLANAYLNDHERTHEAFIDGLTLPWTQRMTARPKRLYKTGDLARYSRGGQIHILGRIDSQIKLKGLRIEVQEIESVLESCEASLRAGVALSRSTSGEEVLCAAITKEEWRDKMEPSILDFTEELHSVVERIAEHSSTLLPTYMRPVFIVPITHLPTLTSGKLDRRRLGEITESIREEWSAKRKSTSLIPHNTIVLSQAESALRDEWARVLGVSAYDIHPKSDFFALGGDSLAAMRLSWAYHTRDKLSMKSVFQHPTLGAMAQAVQSVASAEEEGAAIDARYVPQLSLSKGLVEHVATQCNVQAQQIEDVFPCSPLQEGLFTASLISNGSYYARLAFELGPEIDLVRFRASWDAVYRANPILRTRIVRDLRDATQCCQAVINQPLHWRAVDSEESATEQPRVFLGGELTQWILLERQGSTAIFVLLIHHALYDDVTLRVFYSQFAQLYTNGFLGETTDRLGMKHYIGFLESLDEDRMIESWAASLSGPIATQFPARKRTSHNALTNQVTKVLTASAVSADAWRSNQTTILRAAWAITIARHQLLSFEGESVCFGTVLSERTAPGLAKIMGPLILSIPVVEFVQASEPLPTFLDRVRHNYVRTMDCGSLGLSKIRSIGSEQASACDFNNLFVIQNGELEDEHNPINQIQGLRPLQQDLHHPYGLVVDCTTTKSGIHYSASYDSELLDGIVVSRVLEHFGTAFEQLTRLHSSDDAKVSDILLNLSSDSETNFIKEWNEKPKHPSGLLHDGFLAGANKWSTREAVFAHDRSMTYEQLNDETSRLAADLVHRGVQGGTLVPICFEKCSYMLVAIIAVLRSGAAYVPISPEHPTNRQAYILEQCNASLFLASGEQATILGKVLQTDKTLVRIDRQFFDECLADQVVSWPDGYVSPSTESLAYVLFTSGSTGTPKGVTLSHGAVALSAARHAEKFGHAAKGNVRSLQYCNYTFDVSIMDIFPTLSNGGCVCIPSESDRLGDISSFINRSRADTAMLTPTIADILCPADVPTLRILVVGGEPMTETVRDKWTSLENSPVRTLYNVYGPTEASVNVATCLMSNESQVSVIGSAILGSQLWIAEVDHVERLTPLGCIGELIITGPCLADGYLNSPDQTAKAFVNAPVWLDPHFGSVAYRTGDLARFTSSGEIELIGRIDAQVKLHGIRIELGEIEAAACRVDNVKSAVVICSKPRGRDELILFFDTSLDERTSVRKALDDHLRSSLPRAFLPSLYIMTTIPITSTGKVDRRALSNQLNGYCTDELNYFAIDAAEATKRTPETVEQKELQSLWTLVLHVRAEDVWLETNFFSIGGDSVGVIGLVSLMQRAGYTVSYQEVYARPTLESMAVLMQKSSVKCDVDPSPFSMLEANASERRSLQNSFANALSISTDLIHDAYPCSTMQNSLIAASLQNPKAYWCTIDLELADGTDQGRLSSAWEKVVLNNAILRTIIVNTEEFGNIQVVVGTDPWKVLGECRDGVPLLNRPLCGHRFRANEESPKVFELTMHHAIYDMWVQEALLDQLYEAYDGSNLEKRPSFSRFISFQRQADGAQAFWSNALHGAALVKFPNHRILQNPSEHLMSCHVEGPVALSPGRTSTHSIATIIHCAFALVISRYGNTTHVCYPTVQSGRNISLQGASNIVGPLMTTSFFRADCSHDRTVNEMLADASEFMLDAANHQHAAGSIVPQIFDQSIIEMGNMLVVQPRTHRAESGTSLFHCTSAQMAQPGIILVIATVEDELNVNLRIQYAPEVMDQRNAQLLLSHLQRAVNHLVEPSNLDQSLASVSLLTEQDEMIIQASCGAPVTTSTSSETVGHMMRRLAECYPEAVAVKAHDDTLTYGQLQDSADRLATVLRQKCKLVPGSEVRIAACSERSSIAVVMQVAVFNIEGAAFIALDPMIPMERNLEIVEDSNADLVLFSSAAMHLAKQVAPGRQVLLVSSETLDEIATVNFDESMNAKPNADSIAYITYTSGSSGRPKGCIMSHGPLAFTIAKLTEWKSIDAGVNTLWGSTWSFDVHLSQIWEPLTTGGVISIPSEAEMHTDPEATLMRYNVQHAFFTPTQARSIDFSRATCVRSVAMGGESISFNVEPLLEAGIRIFNEYGPSEAAGCVTGHEITPGDQDRNKIGRAFFGNCWVIEPGSSGRVAPVGTVGELVVGGTLARGYLNRPELTAQAFFDSPSWACSKCPRLYYTGDLVSLDPDGFFRYLGRADTQVKINGVRIEIAEIESRIAEMGFRAVVTALDAGGVGVERSSVLIACIGEEDVSRISANAAKTDAFQENCARLRRKLAQVLPRIMIPRVWIPMTEAKNTSTGKMDRRALRKFVDAYRETSSLDHSSFGDETLTDMEEMVLGLWTSVLKCGPSTLHKSTDFFDLGDSISAIALVAAAARLGHHISVPLLYKNPTLSELALAMQESSSSTSLLINRDPPAFSLLDRHAVKAARGYLDRVLPSNVTPEDVYPVTPLQEVAIIASQRWHRAYYAWFTIELRGTLDSSRLRAASRRLVDTHPLLRTIFFQSGANLLQAPLEHSSLDYREVTWNGDESSVPALLEQDCVQSWHGCRSPTQFRLLQCTGKDHNLVAIGLSHAQYDAFALAKIFDHLIKSYETGTMVQQPAFSRLVQLINSPSQVAASREFWTKRLRGSRMTYLTERASTNRPLLDSTVSSIIGVASQQRNFHAALCLAWATTLGAATRTSDVVFGTLTSGRNASVQDVSSLAGPCITTMPVRINLSQHASADAASEAVEQVRQDHIATSPFEHLGLRRIVKHCTDWPSSTRFPSMVQHQNIEAWKPHTESVSDLQWKHTGSIAYKGLCDEVDLWITSAPKGDREVRVQMLFSEQTLPRGVVEKLLSTLVANLHSILQQPDETHVSVLLAESEERLDRLPLEAAALKPEEPIYAPKAKSETSYSLQTIWNQVLESPSARKFALSDSFYEHGGDSIAAAMVSGLARSQGMELSLQDVAECETFGEQIQRIDHGRRKPVMTSRLEWDDTR